jgi:hypothetical protein
MDETTQNTTPDQPALPPHQAQTQRLSGAPDLPGQLAQATQSLADALHNLDSQFASLHAKIDRIVAAVDDGDLQTGSPSRTDVARIGVEASTSNDHGLRNKVAELEKTNHDLKAQAATARRKTLSPMVSALLAKQGVEGDAVIETPIIEKALTGLSIEQRIAVKAELARAGILA